MAVETKETIRKRKLKKAVRSAIIGALVALLCRALPDEYQGPCATIVKACTGNF